MNSNYACRIGKYAMTDTWYATIEMRYAMIEVRLTATNEMKLNVMQ